MNLNISYHPTLLEKVLHKCNATSEGQSGMGGGQERRVKQKLSRRCLFRTEMLILLLALLRRPFSHRRNLPGLMSGEQEHRKGAAHSETAHCPPRNQNPCESIASACTSYPTQKVTTLPRDQRNVLGLKVSCSASM